MIALFIKHKEFIPKLITIAIPIILQNFISSSLNFLDVIMIGQLGEKEIAAVGIGNQIFFLYSMFFYSIASGVSIFTAQYWGKKDIKSIHSTMGIGISFVLISSIIITLITIFFSRSLINIYTNDQNVIELGAQYLSIISISFIISSLVIVYATVLRSTEHVIFPMIIVSIGLSINTILNYILIYGNFGFPALKVKGAAIATVIAWFVEFIILFCFSYFKKHPTATSIKNIFNFTKEMLKKYIKRWLPVFGQSMGWALGFSTYIVIYGHISTESIAAYNILYTVEGLYKTIFLGLGYACAIMVGNRIGAGEDHKAKDYSKNFLILTFILSIITSVILIIVRNGIINIYNLSDLSRNYLYNLLFILAFVMIARVMNITFNMGILKAGGDTIFSMIIDMGGIWLIGVPLAATAAFILGLPVYYVMALAGIEELVKMIAGYLRFFSNKWIHNLTK